VATTAVAVNLPEIAVVEEVCDQAKGSSKGLDSGFLALAGLRRRCPEALKRIAQEMLSQCAESEATVWQFLGQGSNSLLSLTVFIAEQEICLYISCLATVLYCSAKT
jgi:hypothetical protein